MSELIKNLPHSTTLTLADQLSVQEGQVSSLTLAQQPGCKVTLFAIDTDSAGNYCSQTTCLLYTVNVNLSSIFLNFFFLSEIYSNCLHLGNNYFRQLN